MWCSEESRGEGFSLWGLVAPRLDLIATKPHKLEACATRSSLPYVALALTFLLLLAVPAQATTYYVAAAGSDSNSGTSPGSPWQTIAKVNGSTFSPGDSILFNRGDAWYGTALTAPSSGSSGNPITFGAYGTGANPIVKASTLLSTSGFSLAGTTTVAIFHRPDTGTNISDSATRNIRDAIGHQDIALSASAISITITASPTAAMNVTGSGIGPAATAPNASSITRITWGGGNNSATIAAGTSLTSDTVSYSLNHTADQIVTVHTTNRNVETYGNNFESNWENFSGPDQSQLATVNGYSAGGNIIIAAINATITPVATYSEAFATTPVALWENDRLLALQQNEAFVEQVPGSWYYDGANLFLHATDGSNVATNGKTYSYATASSPSFTTWDNGKSWLIFDSLDQAETFNTSSATVGGLYLTGTNNIARNLSAHDTYRHPFCFYTGGQNNLATNLTLYNSYSTSPICVFGPGTTGNLIQNSTLTNDTYLRSEYNWAGTYWAVAVFHGGSTNNTIDSCIIQSTTGLCPNGCISTATSHGYGVLVGDSGTTATVSHNYFLGSSTGSYEWPVAIGNVGSGGLGTGASATVWGNVIDASGIGSTNDGAQAAIALVGGAGSLIYDNTVYGPSVTSPALSIASSSTGVAAKNNIFLTGGYASVDATSETGAAIDYNDWFGASGTPFNWGGTAYTFANWQANSGQDAHSFSADPNLVNESPLTTSGNYALLATSLAINVGVNLGSTYQNALAPAAAWPGGVSFINQNSAGSGWEIGAYAFLPSSGSTRLLLGCCD
jgi:hypothetical protein